MLCCVCACVCYSVPQPVTAINAVAWDFDLRNPNGNRTLVMCILTLSRDPHTNYINNCSSVCVSVCVCVCVCEGAKYLGQQEFLIYCTYFTAKNYHSDCDCNMIFNNVLKQRE